MKSAIVVFLFISFSIQLSAQSQKQWLRYADVSYAERDYYGASIYYRKAMLLDSTNLYVVYQYAESLRHYNEYTLAATYYDYVLKQDKDKDYPFSLYWLATMQKFEGKYLKARQNYIRYGKNQTNKKSYYYLKTQQEIKSCEFAIGLLKDTVRVVIKNLGDTLRPETAVNTINAEFNVVSLNDSVVYFSSLRSEKMRAYSDEKDKKYWLRIYEAERKDSSWFLKEALDTNVNRVGQHQANASLSEDLQTLYFTRCDTSMKCAIYGSKWKNGRWQASVRLSDSINLVGYTATQPFSAKIDSNEVLFFVSDRPGTYGKLDIWKSVKRNNQFSKPENLGKIINSIDDEVSPVYDAGSKLLYFSSTWHYGLGGFDIFSIPLDGSTLSVPTNLGYPINTSVNDLYYTFNAKNKTGFITSNRKGAMYRKSETCCNDLWSYKLIVPVPIDTIAKDSLSPLQKLMSYLPVKLYFHNDEPNPKKKDTLSSISYLTSYNQYKQLIGVYRENYSKGVAEENKKIAEDTVTNFFENYVDKGVQDLDKFTDLLLQELEKGQQLDLMVKGHASSLAKTDYNVSLTLRRISSLDLYLRAYKDGILIPYLEDSASNSGSLTLLRLPFGEYKAHKLLNDNFHDTKKSVYSIDAALHRNIEIVSVTLSHKDSLHAEMRFLKKGIFDFGASTQGQKLVHTFTYKNTGKLPLLISSMTTSCTCISVNIPSEALPQGAVGVIELTMDTKDLKGKEAHTVLLYTNGVPAVKELSVTTEVH